jgi:hypothetical protein
MSSSQDPLFILIQSLMDLRQSTDLEDVLQVLKQILIKDQEIFQPDLEDVLHVLKRFLELFEKHVETVSKERSKKVGIISYGIHDDNNIDEFAEQEFGPGLGDESNDIVLGPFTKTGVPPQPPIDPTKERTKPFMDFTIEAVVNEGDNEGVNKEVLEGEIMEITNSTLTRDSERPTVVGLYVGNIDVV